MFFVPTLLLLLGLTSRKFDRIRCTCWIKVFSSNSGWASFKYDRLNVSRTRGGNQARNHTSAVEGNIPVFWGDTGL